MTIQALPTQTDDSSSSQTRGFSALVTPAVIAVVLVVIAAPLAPGVVAQDDEAPALPASYHGDVTVNGEDAEAGTEIVALIAGEERGSIEVSEAGTYGGPGGNDDKLVVEGSASDNGAKITFEVRGAEAEETVEWDSGDVQEIDLTFTDVPDSDDSDDSSDSDGGQDSANDGGTSGGGGSSGGTSGGGGSSGTSGGGGGVAPAPVEGTEEPSSEEPEPDAPNTERTPDTDEPENIGGGEGVDSVEIVNEATADITTDAEEGVAKATFVDGAPVTEVKFESASIEGSVEATEVAAAPMETGDPPGSTVSVTDITVPQGAEDQSATVQMRVSSDQLSEIDATAEELRIYRYADGEWGDLDTIVAEETDSGVLLEANTPGFSLFSTSVVGKPVADIRVQSDVVAPGTEITVDAAGSDDQYGEIVSYEWSVTGKELTGETASVSLDSPGEYTVELVVTNDAGETDTTTATVVVPEPDSDAGPETDSTAVDGSGGSTGIQQMFGSIPSVWFLGVGAVVILAVLGLTVALRDDDSV